MESVLIKLHKTKVVLITDHSDLQQLFFLRSVGAPTAMGVAMAMPKQSPIMKKDPANCDSPHVAGARELGQQG